MQTSFLKQILNLPTAPFHEKKVIEFVQNFCGRLGLRCKQDSFGNLKVTYKKGNSKPIAFTAHMDHPGFEVFKTQGLKASVRLLGGVPDKYFLRSKVILWGQSGSTKGKVVKVLNKKKRKFLIKTMRPVGRGSFGYFALPGFRLRGGLIHSKGIDNLVSVALLLNLLQKLVRGKTKAHVICLFTRAEEVGCVGLASIIKKSFLSKKTRVIVLEASSAKFGGVKIGGGPVLRVGDRATSFSYEMDLWLKSVAQKIRNFKYQRALMQGGRCEASVYVVAGYLVGCLALPLGNYHNAGKKGYQTEFISKKDYENMLKWLVVLSH